MNDDDTFDAEAEERAEADKLEALIQELVYRLDDAREGSAEHRMLQRQLVGIRDGSEGELGCLIMEDFTYYRGLSLPDQRPSSSLRTSPGRLAPPSAKPPRP